MKIKTADLQNAVTMVYKGVTNNKLIPVTSLINLMVNENTLFLTSTDSVNYFTTRLEGVESSPFEVSVNADIFTKLIQKMTSDTVSIEVVDTYIMVVGNGKYKIDLLLDENGNPVKFPNNDIGEDLLEEGTIAVTTIKNIINSNKASLSMSSDIPCLNTYYCCDNVITTDRYKVCKTDTPIFKAAKLISPIVMELLSLFSNDTIKYYISKDAISFDGEHEFLYTPLVDGVDKMPINAINGLIDSAFSNNCVVSKSSFLSVLDRLSLFVSPYDKNGVYLTFNSDGLYIESKKASCVEMIPYMSLDTNPFEAYTCVVDIEMLRSQVANNSADSVNIYYSSQVALKFVDGNVIKLVALMEDDRI